jgi:hypothetical protein
MTTFIEENRELAYVLAGAAVALIAGGAALITLGSGAAAAAFAIGGIMSVISGVTALIAAWPIVLGAAAVVASVVSAAAMLALVDLSGLADIRGMLASFMEFGAYLGGEFLAFWNDVSAAATAAIGGITAAIQMGDWKTAGEIAMLGLEAVFQAGYDAIYGIFLDLDKAVLETLAGTALGAISLFQKLATLGGPFAKLLANFAAPKAEEMIGAYLGRAANDRQGQRNESAERVRRAQGHLERRSEEAQRARVMARELREGVEDALTGAVTWDDQTGGTSPAEAAAGDLLSELGSFLGNATPPVEYVPYDPRDFRQTFGDDEAPDIDDFKESTMGMFGDASGDTLMEMDAQARAANQLVSGGATGTFSATAAQFMGLGSGSPMEKVARSSDKTAKGIERLNKQVDETNKHLAEQGVFV